MIDNKKNAFADEGFTVCDTSEYYCGRTLVSAKTFFDPMTVTAKIVFK